VGGGGAEVGEDGNVPLQEERDEARTDALREGGDAGAATVEYVEKPYNEYAPTPFGVDHEDILRLELKGFTVEGPAPRPGLHEYSYDGMADETEADIRRMFSEPEDRWDLWARLGFRRLRRAYNKQTVHEFFRWEMKARAKDADIQYFEAIHRMMKDALCCEFIPRLKRLQWDVTGFVEEDGLFNAAMELAKEDPLYGSQADSLHALRGMRRLNGVPRRRRR
jgi:hypothetical protein